MILSLTTSRRTKMSPKRKVSLVGKAAVVPGTLWVNSLAAAGGNVIETIRPAVEEEEEGAVEEEAGAGATNVIARERIG